MNWTLLAQQPIAIKIHLATVIPAFLLGTWIMFLSKKGSATHRTIGFAYLVLMTITATDAIFVQALHPGHWTWVHLFVPLTYWGVFAALWRIKKRDIKGHQRAMQGLYWGGLIIAGALTFAPGRLMGKLFWW